jgi:hypothetical protein
MVAIAMTVLLGHVSAKALRAQNAPASGGACRAYSADETRVSVSSRGKSALHITCKFDRGTNQHVCHESTSSYAYDQITQYASVADFVGDAARVTFFPHAQSITVKFPGSLSGQAYAYDSRGRLASITTTSSAGAGGSTLQTFNAWDAVGRPTAGRDENQNFVFTYDDAQRVFTQRSDGPGGVITLKFDADGNHALSTTVTPTFSDTTTITVKTTEKICK